MTVIRLGGALSGAKWTEVPPASDAVNARALAKEEFRREVEKEPTGREEESSELTYFQVYKSQILVAIPISQPAPNPSATVLP